MHNSFTHKSTNSYLISPEKLQNMNCIEQPCANYGGLFIGDIICMLKHNMLSDNRIGAILSCVHEKNIRVNGIVQKTIDMRDALDYPIHVHFDETNRWIEQMRQQNLNVLVHCHAGVSRSVAIVCAYLMKKNQWGMKQALTYIKGKRKRAKPNQHFINQLYNYEQELTHPIQKQYQPQQRYSYKTPNMYHTAYITPSTMYNSVNHQPQPRDKSYNLPNRTATTTTNQSRSGKNHLQNKVSQILGRKTRIPWELLGENKLRSIKQQLFEKQQESVERSGCNGCF